MISQPSVMANSRIPLSPSQIILIDVARAHEVQPHHITGTRGFSEYLRARDEAAWRMRHELGMSYSAIGRRLNRDHCTVIVAVRRHQARLDAGRDG